MDYLAETCGEGDRKYRLGFKRYSIHEPPLQLSKRKAAPFKLPEKPTFDPVQIFQPDEKMNTIHSFKVAGIEGEVIDFAAFAGKKIMVLNFASECGFTPHPDNNRDSS